jgi:hypothetical protein
MTGGTGLWVFLSGLGWVLFRFPQDERREKSTDRRSTSGESYGFMLERGYVTFRILAWYLLGRSKLSSTRQIMLWLLLLFSGFSIPKYISIGCQFKTFKSTASLLRKPRKAHELLYTE